MRLRHPLDFSTNPRNNLLRLIIFVFCQRAKRVRFQVLPTSLVFTADSVPYVFKGSYLIFPKPDLSLKKIGPSQSWFQAKFVLTVTDMSLKLYYA
jgi:hypothetical protein